MRLAVWLLERFGVSERNESLTGDLTEERAAGRSAAWFWRQTFSAIGDTVLRDLREHWPLALRAIATGYAVTGGWLWGMRMLFSGVAHDSHGYLAGYLWRAYQVLSPFTFVLWPLVVGWIVARTHRAQQAAMVLAFAASVAFPGAWYLTTHYSQMERGCVQCVPDVWVVNLAIYCLFVLGILIGGLLLTRPKRTSLRTPTL